MLLHPVTCTLQRRTRWRDAAVPPVRVSIIAAISSGTQSSGGAAGRATANVQCAEALSQQGMLMHHSGPRLVSRNGCSPSTTGYSGERGLLPDTVTQSQDTVRHALPGRAAETSQLLLGGIPALEAVFYCCSPRRHLFDQTAPGSQGGTSAKQAVSLSGCPSDVSRLV